MKKVSFFPAALITAAALALLMGSAASGAVSSRTTRGTVVARGTIVTDDGHEWNVDTSGIPRDVRVIVTFNTRGTEDVTDDVIVDIQPIKVGTGFTSVCAQSKDITA